MVYCALRVECRLGFVSVARKLGLSNRLNTSLPLNPTPLVEIFIHIVPIVDLPIGCTTGIGGRALRFLNKRPCQTHVRGAQKKRWDYLRVRRYYALTLSRLEILPLILTLPLQPVSPKNGDSQDSVLTVCTWEETCRRGPRCVARLVGEQKRDVVKPNCLAARAETSHQNSINLKKLKPPTLLVLITG